MAFSTLGTVIKAETVLEEKRCVEKTWLNWWDDLENKVCCKVRTSGHDLITPFRSGLKSQVWNSMARTPLGHSARRRPWRPD